MIHGESLFWFRSLPNHVRLNLSFFFFPSLSFFFLSFFSPYLVLLLHPWTLWPLLCLFLSSCQYFLLCIVLSELPCLSLLLSMTNQLCSHIVSLSLFRLQSHRFSITLSSPASHCILLHPDCCSVSFDSVLHLPFSASLSFLSFFYFFSCIFHSVSPLVSFVWALCPPILRFLFCASVFLLVFRSDQISDKSSHPSLEWDCLS